MGWLWVAIPATLYSIWYLAQIWFDDTELYRMKFYRNRKPTNSYLEECQRTKDEFMKEAEKTKEEFIRSGNEYLEKCKQTKL